MAERSYEEAVRETFIAEMRANERLLLFSAGGCGTPGAEPLSDACLRHFGGERVRIVAGRDETLWGAAYGAALCGYRAVLDLGASDSLLAGLRRLAQQISQRHYRSAGETAVPLVVRVGASENDPHAQRHPFAVEAWLAQIPGVFVTAPSTPADGAGLLKTALRETASPTLILEPMALAGLRGDVPGDLAPVPFGSAAVRRQGKDLTVVAYGPAAALACDACDHVAQRNGIDAELIDLRTLAPLDIACILESVRKTGRVLLCSCAPRTANIVCEIAMLINERGFDDLDAPVRRICALDVPAPLAGAERAAAALPGSTRIAEAICELAQA